MNSDAAIGILLGLAYAYAAISFIKWLASGDR